jgi:outer membrane protein OmpA-like peptidoglycan-associated protein
MTGVASADPVFKSQDVVNHFVSAKAKPPTNLGLGRGVCIGPETKCGGAVVPPEPKPFDLVITFGYDSDALTDQARQNLDEFSKALNDSSLASSSVIIEGHTDGRGSESYNLSLSERRASAVARYLSDKGVSQDRLVPKGLGKTKPRSPDPMDAANRRVEAHLR